MSAACPIILLAASGKIFSKSLANMQEVKAEKGKVVRITTWGCDILGRLVVDLILQPECRGIVKPILMSIPIQLSSYHVTLGRGYDVDNMQNLAKLVMVE